MQQSAYLILQNINTAQNKRRAYQITVTGLSVQLRWGRMNCHARQKVVAFQEEEEMLKFLQVTLRKRERHGYQLVARSEWFSEVGSLEQLKVNRFEPVQLSLF